MSGVACVVVSRSEIVVVSASSVDAVCDSVSLVSVPSDLSVIVCFDRHSYLPLILFLWLVSNVLDVSSGCLRLTVGAILAGESIGMVGVFVGGSISFVSCCVDGGSGGQDVGAGPRGGWGGVARLSFPPLGQNPGCCSVCWVSIGVFHF